MSRSPWRRRRRLTRSLTETLQAKADQVHVSASTMPFTADRPPSSVAADDLAAGQEWTAPGGAVRQTARQRLLPAAAVVVLVVLVGAAVVARQANDDDAGDRIDVDTLTPATDGSDVSYPSGTLLPTWVPDDVEPWTVEWTRRTFPALPGDRYQLFGDPNAGRALLVWITPGQVDAGGGGEIAVRGRNGTYRLASGAARDAATIVWSEEGASITAWFRGMEPPDAVAVLDQLEWRSATYADGFDAGADGSFPLQGETSWTDSYDILATDLGYSEGVPTLAAANGHQAFEIHTFTYSESGGAARDFLQAWFYGSRQADGSAQSFDASSETLHRSWPDGRSVQIRASGSGLDQATLERVAASSRLSTSTDLAGLASQADANLATLPVLASVDLSVGDVTVRGQDGVLALCLEVRAGAEPDCDSPAVDQVWFDQVDATASWVVGGTWYVAAASTAGERARVDIPSDADAPTGGDDVLPEETHRDGRWEVVVSRPPADVDQVATSAGFVFRPT